MMRGGTDPLEATASIASLPWAAMSSPTIGSAPGGTQVSPMSCYERDDSARTYRQGMGAFGGLLLPDETTALRLDWYRGFSGDAIRPGFSQTAFYRLTLRVIVSLGPHKAYAGAGSRRTPSVPRPSPSTKTSALNMTGRPRRHHQPRERIEGWPRHPRPRRPAPRRRGCARSLRRHRGSRRAGAPGTPARQGRAGSRRRRTRPSPC